MQRVGSQKRHAPPWAELPRETGESEGAGQLAFRKIPPPCTELLRDGAADGLGVLPADGSLGRPAPQFQKDMPWTLPWREPSREGAGVALREGGRPCPQFHTSSAPPPPPCTDDSREGAGVTFGSGERSAPQSHRAEAERAGGGWRAFPP